MKSICDFLPFVYRLEPLFFYIGKLYAFQCPQKLFGCIVIFQFPLQQPEMQQRKETDKEMGSNPFFPAQVNRTCIKFLFHCPEAVLDLPPSFAYF